MKKNPNIDTNYYLQRRYDNAEMETNDISFEPDTGSVMHVDYSHDSIYKLEKLNELNNCIEANMAIKSIVEEIPVNKIVNLSIENVNKIYSFCMILREKNKILGELNKMEMFDLVTSYLNLDEKETSYFYKNLSIKFKQSLLEELEDAGLYKNNKLF